MEKPNNFLESIKVSLGRFLQIIIPFLNLKERSESGSQGKLDLQKPESQYSAEVGFQSLVNANIDIKTNELLKKAAVPFIGGQLITVKITPKTEKLGKDSNLEQAQEIYTMAYYQPSGGDREGLKQEVEEKAPELFLPNVLDRLFDEIQEDHPDDEVLLTKIFKPIYEKICNGYQSSILQLDLANYCSSPITLFLLVKEEKNQYLRAKVAQKPVLNKKTIAILAQDPDYIVRVHIAAQPDLDPELVELLRKDSNDKVKEEINRTYPRTKNSLKNKGK